MKIYDFFEREIIKYKFLAKPFIILAFIYCLGIVSIIRANFNYIDDLGRVSDGYRGWMNWSRYISEGLSVLIHTDSRLMDISPLPQILACLILAFASGKRFVKGVLPFSNELRHKQYHIFIMLFDHNQSGTDCGLYFGNDIFPLNKGINRRCVFRQYLP